LIVIFSDIFGGTVPYVRTPKVAVSVGAPSNVGVCEPIGVLTAASPVAVAGVVVRFGIVVCVGVSELEESRVVVGED